MHCTRHAKNCKPGVNAPVFGWRRYPSADEKVRTQALEIMGGGNCGNTLSA